VTEDELAKIPRQSAQELSTAIPGGPGYHHRLLVALESHANVEWWRGYYEGRKQVVRHLQDFAERQAKPLKVS
jgi:hypothetical protein